MQLYKLRIAYDGTEYHGWQVQEHERTIAGMLEQRFLDTFSCPVSIVGASRTDGGVHAYDQVALCRTGLDLDPEQLKVVWNRALPADIMIRSLVRTNMDFHPHHGVVEKTYWYHIFEQRPSPFIARYGWYQSRKIDYQKLEESLQYAVGTHDFRSFCTGEDHASTIRTIHGIDVIALPRYHAIRIVVRGPSFLYRMIRRIVGGAVHVATHRSIDTSYFHEILEARNPLHMLTTAPARGLLLRKIRYGVSQGEEKYERSVSTEPEFLEMARGSD